MEDNKRGFFLSDDLSGDFYVGRIFRAPEQLGERLRSLEVGQSYYRPNGRFGWHRFQ